MDSASRLSTGMMTDTVRLALSSPTVAVMVVSPSATPVITPFSSTVAIASSLLV